MSIWRWGEYFSDTTFEHQITLGEGNTPLVRSHSIGPQAGIDNLYFKLESANPTGSYKDRFAAAAISDMLAHDKTRAVGTTSGNTGSAFAAYCAAARIPCEIAILEWTPPGKLKQMLAYGAQLYKVKGMGVDADVSLRVFEELRAKTERTNAQLLVSAFMFSPAGMAGVQTISYELAEQSAKTGFAIDHVFSPAGGGGLTLAVTRGFADLVERKELKVAPAVHCAQPVGNNTMAGPLREGLDRGQAVDCTSQISGLQVGSIIDANKVIPACRATGGNGFLVTDDTVWSVQKRLAREEGIFCEPAGAVALAAALDAAAEGEVQPSESVVCLVTGIGFKDPPSVDRMIADCDCPTIEVQQIGTQ